MRGRGDVQIEGGAQNSVIVTGDGCVVVYQSLVLAPDPLPESPDVASNPYRGLEAFTERDANRYFGREALVRRLWTALRSLQETSVHGDTPRFLPILGPSGSGKSSLVRAGLIPELARSPLPGRPDGQVVVVVPGEHPIEALAAALAQMTDAEDQGELARDYAAELRRPKGGAEHGLRRVIEGSPVARGRYHIVVVDQFEEIYSLCRDEEERRAFVATLLDAAREPRGTTSIIVTMRSDFLGALSQDPALSALFSRYGVLVPALSPDELRRAIAEPARIAGHPIDAASVNLLIAQTSGREGALPLLQFALSQIWNGMALGRAPADTLEAIGGVGGALAAEAERLFTSLSEPDQAVARRYFLAMVQLGDETQHTRRRIVLARQLTLNETEADVLRVLRVFGQTSARLVTFSAVKDETTVEVTHEALLDHWKRLGEWLAASRDDLRLLRRIDEEAVLWAATGFPEGSLWRTPDLDLACDLKLRSPADLSARSSQFIEAGVGARETEDKRARDRARLSRLATIAMSLLALIAVGFAWFAMKQNAQSQIARAQAQVALSRTATDAGEATAGLLVAIAALEQLNRVRGSIQAREEAQDAVSYALSRIAELRVFRAGRPISDIAISPDGRRLAIATDEKVVRLYDTKTGSQEQPLRHDADVHSLAFSPDGRRLITAPGDMTARIWTLDGSAPPVRLDGHEHHVNARPTFSPDGRWALTPSWDGTAMLWDARTGKHRATIPTIGRTTGAQFSGDGHFVIVTSDGIFPAVWNVATEELIEMDLPAGEPLDGRGPSSWTARLSPDNTLVAGTYNFANRAGLWDARSGRMLASLTLSDETVSWLEFSPDGALLLTASDDGYLRLWNSRSPTRPLREIRAPAPPIQVLFSHEGEAVTAITSDGRISTWTLEGVKIRDIKAHEAAATSLVASADGNWIFTASDDRTVRMWEANSSAARVAKGDDAQLASLSFSQDGSLIVAGGPSDRVQVIGTANGRPHHVLRTGGTTLWARLDHAVPTTITADRNHLIQTWSLATGRPVKAVEVDQDGVVKLAADLGEEKIMDYVLSGFSGPDLDSSCVSFSPDGALVASVNDEGFPVIKELATEKTVAEFKIDQVDCSVFAPDGRSILWFGAEDPPTITTVRSSEILHSLEGHYGAVLTGRFSGDGRLAITGGDDGMVRVWDASQGLQVAQLNGSGASVRALDATHDGSLVLTGGEDGRVRVWNLATGRVVAVHEAGQPLDFAKFIPGGRGVVLATRDGAISIWRPILSREDRLLRAAKARAPRGLSPTEQLELGLTNATPIWKRLQTQVRAWGEAAGRRPGATATREPPENPTPN